MTARKATVERSSLSGPFSESDVASYISDLSGELAALAAGAGMEDLSATLERAQNEAQHQLIVLRRK